AFYDNTRLPDDIRERAEEIIEKQCFDYENDHIGTFFIDEAGGFDEELEGRIRDILLQESLLLDEDYFEDVPGIFENSFLERKITSVERIKLLKALSGTDHNVRFYTDSDISKMPDLRRINKGYAEYYRTMPKVFANSRINLNITLRSIHTGIPLRALDIMGCGGFLLSDYQAELAENFEEGREMVMFRDLDDCLAKIEYYLSHEDERRQIAQTGKKAVLERFDMKDQLSKLFML
nr:glycosyltransferase [Lachnospiraceae bacterium]